jgi:hypothetical protein
MAASEILEELVRETHKTEEEILALAVQAGLRQLRRDHALGKFLRGQITRDQAIEAVGIDWVELAERQHQAAREDLAWGLDG